MQAIFLSFEVENLGNAHSAVCPFILVSPKPATAMSYFYNFATPHSGPRPFYHAMRLIWPFPWYLPIPPQLPVSALLEDRGIIMRRKMFDVSYTELRFVPLFCMRDTPLRALYRLYECTCTVSENETMEEGMYIFHRQPQWRIKDISDPKDSDPLRYAILASLTETMVEAFNYKIKLGLRRGITNEKPLLIASFAKESDPPYEEPPPWCATVGPLQDALILDPRFKISAHKHFRKRSIVVHVEQLWNV